MRARVHNYLCRIKHNKKVGQGLEQSNAGKKLIDKYEPFDVIALLFTFGGFACIMTGALFNHIELFESGKQVMVGVFSAYVGKKWGSNK